jgi:CHAT domain-containing protein/Tfp pilus assembly protein PilF
MGDLPQALARHQRALQVFEKVYGQDDAFTATAYSNLGSDYTDLGDLQKALEYYQQALAISLRVLGPDHPEVVTDYANLGTVYANLGDPARALEYHTRAYQHALALHGPDHPDVASALGLLGSDARDAGDNHKALTYYSRALEVRERTLGADHPDTALTRNNLGFTYLQLGETQKALSALQQALSADTRVLGPSHPRTGTVLSNIAAVHAKLGQYELALPELSRSLDIVLQNQQAAFTVLDDPGKVKYNATIRSDFWGSFHIQTDYAHANPVRAQAYVAPALNAWLSFKGSAFALENGLALLTAHADAPLKASLETYLENRREFAQRATAVPSSVADARVNAARLEALKGQIAGLEAQFSARVGSFRLLLALNRIRLEELAAHLGKNEVYIDYAWFNSQLFAFTLDHAAHVHLFTLGRTDDLQAGVEALRVGAESGRSLKNLRPNVTALYDRLLRPLQGALKGASTLVISPDGPLNFLPFELLSDGKQTVLEHDTVRYTPSGRDLLRLRSTTGTHPGPSAVFGNPSFAGSLPVAPSATPSVSVALPEKGTLPDTGGAASSPAPDLGPTSPVPRVRSLSSLLRGTVFSTLPGTQAEARSVADLLGTNTQAFLAAAANETNLFNLRSPRVLHLATHGFLLRNTPLPNPLLRVGIALSGAQTAVNSGASYGLLSGLQLASLHLEGTQLVVLSACETGLGDAIAGEGVSGLNQAFLTAGARQVLLSLWKVPDVQTGELMTEFYRRYTAGTEAASALRAAQLTLMRRGLPPRDWAAFLLNGD